MTTHSPFALAKSNHLFVILPSAVLVLIHTIARDTKSLPPPLFPGMDLVVSLCVPSSEGLHRLPEVCSSPFPLCHKSSICVAISPILDRSRQRRPHRRPPLSRRHSRPNIVPSSSSSRPPNSSSSFVPPHLQLPHHHRRAVRPPPLFPSRQTQRGRALMGDGVLEGGSVFNHLLIQIHPFRKHIWSLCALCLLLSLLIILNSVLIISLQGSSSYRLGDPTFVIFSEVLAWLLILVSVVGFKLTCMSAKIVEANSNARRAGDDGGTSLAPALPSVSVGVDGADWAVGGARRPFSAPHWVNAYWGLAADGSAVGDGAIGLPGVVEPQPPFDPFLYPPPPPRYSSLGGTSVAPPAGGPRPASPRPRRPCHHSAQFLRSPPPPYCPALTSTPPPSVVLRPSLFPSAD